MKNPCPLCESRKAQRRCMRQDNAVICSPCCVAIRNETCSGCSHYAAAQQYQASRSPSPRRPDGHFVVEIDKRVESAVDSAMELAEHGNTSGARTMLTRLLRDHPDDPNVCYGVGTLHAISGELKESIEWFDKAIAASPDFLEAYYNKAASHQKMLEVGNAIRAYRKVAELGDPRDMPAKRAKSFLDEMEACIQKSEGVNLDCYLDSMSEFERAVKLMERKDWAGALAGFRASAAKIDRNAPVHGNMGLCLAHLGHRAQALAEFDRALEIDSDYSLAIENRAVAEQMVEGAPLKDTRFKIVEFAKEKILGRRAQQ